MPVEAHNTACEPSLTAWVIAMVMPRSLNEPVGFTPSNFTCNSTSLSLASEIFPNRTSGVLPSPRVIIRASSATGRRSR